MPRLKKEKSRLLGNLVKGVLFTAIGFITSAWLSSLGTCHREDKISDSHALATQGTSGKLFRMTRIRSEGLRDTQVAASAPFQSPLLDEMGSEFPICDTWAVITSINLPTTTVKQLVSIPLLCVCVVADRKSPAVYELDRVVYLTPAIQERLPYEIVRHVPWNHFGRKNLGFMFAIHHGGKVIYDTDDDNEIIARDAALLPHTERVEISTFFNFIHPVNQSTETVIPTTLNPYPFFGASKAWPRGIPLDQVRDSTADTRTVEVSQGHGRKIGVIQSLANHDPDVDAIYRLSSLSLPFSFSDAEVLAALQPHTLMCPYNAQATLHFQSAFWALLLPITVHGRVSDIWRSYLAQRLFWETGDVVAFASPWVTQFRNPHNYLADFDAEQDLYRKSSAFVEYLTHTWRCQSTLTLAACFESLYVDMYNNDILQEGDLKLVRAWLRDLSRVGYVFPMRINQEAEIF